LIDWCANKVAKAYTSTLRT